MVNRRSWVVKPGSWIVNRRSWVVKPGSWIVSPRSWIVNPGSWTAKRESCTAKRGSAAVAVTGHQSIAAARPQSRPVDRGPRLPAVESPDELAVQGRADALRLRRLRQRGRDDVVRREESGRTAAPPRRQEG